MHIRQLPIDDPGRSVRDKVRELLGGEIITLLRLTTLRCGATEEWIGADETYLKFSFDPALAGLDAAAQEALEAAVRDTGLGVLALEVPEGGIPFDTGVLGDGDSAQLDVLLPVVAGMTVKVEQELDVSRFSLTALTQAQVEEDALDLFHYGVVWFGRDGAYYELGYELHRFRLEVSASGHGPA